MGIENKSLYVHFDGVDLAGKSTASRNFVNTVGGEWAIWRNRIAPENKIHRFADEIRLTRLYDVEVVGHVYYAALMADIRNFEWPKQNTIQDSTIILRSIAHHTVAKTPNLPEMFTELLIEHPKFDVSFVFTASLEARQERLAKQLRETPETVSNHDRMCVDHPEEFLAMEACLIETAKKVFDSRVINTSDLTQSQVLDVLLKNVPLVKPNKDEESS